MPTTAPLHPWEISEDDLSRLHIDYASPYKGHMFLVIEDWFRLDNSTEDYSERAPEKTSRNLKNIMTTRSFREGVLVYAKNFYTGPRWKGGAVKRQTDPLSYEIELESGTVVRRHVDQDGRAG